MDKIPVRIVDGHHVGRVFEVDRNALEQQLVLSTDDQGEFAYRYMGIRKVQYLFKWVENHEGE